MEVAETVALNESVASTHGVAFAVSLTVPGRDAVPMTIGDALAVAETAEVRTVAVP